MREFKIRLNAVDFTDLQDRLHRPITILNGVDFKRSVLEHFIEAFKELVALNGTYDTDQVRFLIYFHTRFYLFLLWVPGNGHLLRMYACSSGY